MALTLPYDVWCLIAKYIPEADLLQLFSVNAALFDLAMNKQYREVLIDYHKDESMPSRLFAMGPAVLKRVQSLSLQPLSYYKPPKPKTGMREKLKNHLKMLLKIRSNLKLTRFQMELQRRIEQMSQLTSLDIGGSPSDNLESFIYISPLIQTVWMTHGHQLTSLTLSIPLEAFALCQPIPPLNALTELRLMPLSLLKSNTTSYEEILVAMARFIGLHASSLNKLSIDIPYSPPVDLLHLISNIPQLPHLTSLSLILWFEHLKPECHIPVDRLLELHATSLTEFSVGWRSDNFDQMPSPEVFFSSPIFQVNLRSLKTLDICLCGWGQNLKESVTENLIRYLRRFKTSLAQLTIRKCFLTYNQVKDIVNIFSGQKSQLHSLQLEVYFLSGTLLDLLYQQLPQLHTLHLRFGGLLGQDDGLLAFNYYWDQWDDYKPHTRIVAFSEYMKGREYPDWGLRLTLNPMFPESYRWNDSRTALLKALPSTILVNEV